MNKLNKKLAITKCGFLLAAFAVLVSNTHSFVFLGEPKPPKSLLK
ncbi:MAG: cyclic lactone autoinducer peptide [Clostridium sp.]|jgi:cyclic lactone autoinducer peptide|nr:cyclic lactone autoinducer peptide [Clostridium sp.]MCH3963669.1 cyclic lactone autoinducer peptide [Clostridium sp.]MCI1714810.1 cyclic lactone autoinducer peptide [Clostridium sp.]MCI1799001.1 cyclic lactone autoinducer peptide [Clostridium sp.]MCI1812993.1 cyclic lactone autoinducer peptide [Clostridium sp.]MCI1869883.1 cyclic lactone autoinducer peptide [Clostridium sp.]